MIDFLCLIILSSIWKFSGIFQRVDTNYSMIQEILSNWKLGWKGIVWLDMFLTRWFNHKYKSFQKKGKVLFWTNAMPMPLFSDKKCNNFQERRSIKTQLMVMFHQEIWKNYKFWGLVMRTCALKNLPSLEIFHHFGNQFLMMRDWRSDLFQRLHNTC